MVQVGIEDGKLYRGGVPFYLKGRKGRVIYLTSSNKNINDYYGTLEEENSQGKLNLLKVENYSYSEDEFDRINFKLQDILKKEEFILLISIETLLKGYFLKGKRLKLKKGGSYPLKELILKLEENNFRKNYLVEKPGDYSLRGDILDIFPMERKDPIRIELFDELIEEIRIFDEETQRSKKHENIDAIDMYISKNKEEDFSFLELVKGMGKSWEEIEIYMENQEILDYKLEEYILSKREDEEKLRKRYKEVKDIAEKIQLVRLDSEEAERYKDRNYLKKLSKKKKVILYTNEEKRQRELFHGSEVVIEKKNHYEGFKTKEFLVVTDRELKGIQVKRTVKREKKLRYKKIEQIQPMDYIIHETYGVGIYLGIEIINGEDYLAIRYADEDKLFVPIEGLDKIERFIGEPGEVPDIYRLGRKGFKKKQEKIKKDLEKFARELIEIQARRATKRGFPFTKDTVWQEEFEEGFPYNESKDQLKAINDVKRDMESSKVMDRVVCGDVGYGKTEVAMRAAFKAIMDGKQVALLAPTTVLAAQHYERFKERFQNFPMKLELISRLKTGKEQKLVVEQLKTGEIDLIIGTHRLLSEDIKFLDLGLVIIDEEQKFGVKAKEHLKNLRINVDMLTLTATPIPRTLNLALLGIRDISIIQTPPRNRQPIENFIIEKNESDIKKAILKEVAREGQVFYIYNSVKGMETKLKELRKIIPSYLTIDYIHGQMPSSSIKRVIERFEGGDLDILLTTTIIENGIDIENANTIIIENFDRLGLSQIYQLRGRVGRSGRAAYCYLVTESLEKGTKQGKKKRDSMMTLGGLGAGFQLSLEDMKIRGAGEILGEKQHGALKIYGYDMYLKMLDKEIKSQRGEKELEKETSIDIGVQGYIPKTYIEEGEKIVIYRRLIGTDNLEELENLRNEVEDRFGRLPNPVKDLFYFIEVKILGKKLGIKSIEFSNGVYSIQFEDEKADIDILQGMILSEKVQYLQKKKMILVKDLNKFIKEYMEEGRS